MSDDRQVEQQIQAKGLTAPRVTPEQLEDVIVSEHYFTVTGESACASPENFDAELGRQIARRNAREKIWMLEGYLLRQRLHDAGDPALTEMEG